MFQIFSITWLNRSFSHGGTCGKDSFDAWCCPPGFNATGTFVDPGHKLTHNNNIIRSNKHQSWSCRWNTDFKLRINKQTSVTCVAILMLLCAKWPRRFLSHIFIVFCAAGVKMTFGGCVEMIHLSTEFSFSESYTNGKSKSISSTVTNCNKCSALRMRGWKLPK